VGREVSRGLRPRELAEASRRDVGRGVGSRLVASEQRTRAQEPHRRHGHERRRAGGEPLCDLAGPGEIAEREGDQACCPIGEVPQVAALAGGGQQLRVFQQGQRHPRCLHSHRGLHHDGDALDVALPKLAGEFLQAQTAVLIRAEQELTQRLEVLVTGFRGERLPPH
jgi:hypothetical protein